MLLRRKEVWIKAYLTIIGLVGIFLGLLLLINPDSIVVPADKFSNILYMRTFGSFIVAVGIAFVVLAPQFQKHWRKLIVALSLLVMLMTIFLTFYFINGFQVWFGVLFILNFALLSLPIIKIIYAGFEKHRMLEEQLNYFYTTRANLDTYLIKTDRDVSLLELSSHQPTMLVFLRHFGCAFCREALSTLSRDYSKISSMGTKVVIVHMAGEQEAKTFMTKYDLKDVHLISDPGQHLYHAFSLEQGTWNQLLGLKVIVRAFLGGVLWRNSHGRQMGDIKQLPGVFLLHQGEVVKSYRHYTAADTPDYVQLASCRSCA